MQRKRCVDPYGEHVHKMTRFGQRLLQQEANGARARQVALDGLRQTELGRKRRADEAFDGPFHTNTSEHSSSTLATSSTLPSATDSDADGSFSPSEDNSRTTSHKRRRAAKATGNPAYNAAAGPIKSVFGELSSIVNRAESDAVESSNRLRAEANDIARDQVKASETIAANLKLLNGLSWIAASADLLTFS